MGLEETLGLLCLGKSKRVFGFVFWKKRLVVVFF